MAVSVVLYAALVTLSMHAARLLGLKHTGLILALACDFSFAWAAFRFFGRAGGLRPPQRWALRSTAATAVVQGAAILYANHGTIWHFVAGMVLYAASLVLFWWAAATSHGRGLELFFSDRPPGGLIEHGPYRAIRHPFYTAYTLSWVAGAVLIDQPALLLLAALNLAMYTRAARGEEEQFDRSDLAASYRAYRRRAGMFWPRLSHLAAYFARPQARLEEAEASA